MAGLVLSPRRNRGRRLAAVVLALAVLTLGCGHHVDGVARPESGLPDRAFFFAGTVPTYGRAVSPDDRATLAYLRALRRIDVCGILDRQALAKLGEITSVATLYAFNECDVAVKVPGVAALRFISAELILGRAVGPPAMRVSGVEVHETRPGSCEYLVPLQLSRLPGAPPQRPASGPFVHVAMIGAGDCGLAQRAARATAQHVATAPLPPRDGAAVYTVPLAERDPCEVLSVLDDAGRWDIGGTGVYECAMGVGRLALRPSLVDIVTDNGAVEVEVVDGTEIYLDPELCTATAFVGPPMRRRLANGDYADVPNVVVRPSVVAEGGDDCRRLVGIAAAAARVYR